LLQINPGGQGIGDSIPIKGHIEPFGHCLQNDESSLS